MTAPTPVELNRVFHNNNEYFYTLSPAAIGAISTSFALLARDRPELLSEGGFYEFGVFKGFTLWFAEIAHRHLTGKSFRYYGFDSFEGLPSGSIDQNDWWLPGNYAASHEQVAKNMAEHGADFSRIHLCKGWFSPELFTNFAKTVPLNRVAVVNIDSDMYESCVAVLDFFGSKFERGTILLMDEIRNTFPEDPHNHGELKALTEYISRHPNMKVAHLFDYGVYGSAFQVVEV